jgi:hypothetical protein
LYPILITIGYNLHPFSSAAAGGESAEGYLKVVGWGFVVVGFMEELFAVDSELFADRSGWSAGSWMPAQPKKTPDSAVSIQETPSTGMFAVGIPSWWKLLASCD